MMKNNLFPTLVVSATLCIAATCHAQLQWLSYDTGGNLLNANAGSGGDGASTVSFVVPAGQTIIYLTRNFEPLDFSADSAVISVDFTFDLSAGLTGTASGVRVMGWGLYNTAGTASDVTDDAGFWTRFNYGNYPETFSHNTGANLFSGSQLGQGGSYTGSPVDQTTYDALIRVRNAGSGNASMGSGTDLGSAGAAIQGSGVDQRAYTSTTATPGGYYVYDQFAFYFNNATAGGVTLTLGGFTLSPTIVPEPSVIAIAGLGLLGLVAANRRRN